MRNFLQIKNYLPEIDIDGVKIEHFTLTESFVRMEQARGEYWLTRGLRSNYEYTKLVINESIWMSDTPMEQNTNCDFLQKANGHVIVFGLGIGLIIIPLLADKDIKSITVVELNKSIANNVFPLIKKHDSRNILTCINGNADDYFLKIPKETKFDTIYFDIWKDICFDNYEHMKTLERKYRKFVNRTNHEFFISSWLKDKFKSEQRKQRNSYFY